MELSICIVNWNTRQLLAECLESIEPQRDDLQLQTVVVDNGSSDGSAEMVRERFGWVELTANAENRYYAGGNNQAMEQAVAPLVLLLNSDVRIPPGGLRYLVDWMARHPRAGAVAPRLVYPDGRPQRSCRGFPDPDAVICEMLGLSRLFPRSRRFGKYRMTWWEHDDERAVDQPMASAFLIRAEALRQVGLFDEQFPMYFNDVDLCRRLWDAGWEIWFTPAVSVAHHHGASTRLAKRSMIAESGRSFLAYYRKHYAGKVPWPSYAAAVALLRVAYACRLAWAALRRT